MKTTEIEFSSIKSKHFLEAVVSATELICSDELLNADAVELTDLIVTYSAEIEEEHKGFLKTLRRKWKKWEHQLRLYGKNCRVTVKPDTEITSHDLETSSFVIYDTPASKVLAQYFPVLPVRIEGKKIVGGGGVFEGDNLQVSTSVLNPFNRQKIFTIVRRTSPFPLSGMAGIWLPKTNTYIISRVSKRLKDVEKGCLEFNDQRRRIEFLTGNNYKDDNDWVCVKSDHHVFCVRPGSLAQKDIKQLIQIHEKAYEKFMARLGIRPKRHDLYLCYLHERENEEIDLKGGIFLPARSEFHVIYNEKIKRQRYSGPHELVHAISSRYFGNGVPPILDEGIAELLSWDRERTIEYYSAKMMHSGVLTELKDLINHDNFKKYWKADTYSQSASFVKFLIERYGIKRFRDLMNKTGKKRSKTVKVFESVYNKSLTNIEKEWKSFLPSG